MNGQLIVAHGDYLGGINVTREKNIDHENGVC
jgi:hypothetical protein